MASNQDDVKRGSPFPEMPGRPVPPDVESPSDFDSDESIEALFAEGDEEDLEHLLENFSHLAPPTEGEVLQGHVLKITPKEVIVDFGYKTEGLVPLSEFQAPDGTVSIRPGDTVRSEERRVGKEC